MLGPSKPGMRENKPSTALVASSIIYQRAFPSVFLSTLLVRPFHTLKKFIRHGLTPHTTGILLNFNIHIVLIFMIFKYFLGTQKISSVIAYFTLSVLCVYMFPKCSLFLTLVVKKITVQNTVTFLVGMF